MENNSSCEKLTKNVLVNSIKGMDASVFLRKRDVPDSYNNEHRILIPAEGVNPGHGIWIKYEKGIDPDVFFYDIKWDNVRCELPLKDTDIRYKDLVDGDIYVYYALNNKERFPRVVIATDDDSIKYIYSIDNLNPNFTFDDEMVNVVSSMLNILNLKSSKNYDKILNDMKKLTDIHDFWQYHISQNKKSMESIDNQVFGEYDSWQKKEDLTREELRFLYEIDESIESFNMSGRDSRIFQILKTRNKRKDLATIFACKENQISLNMGEALNGDIVCHYGDILIVNKTDIKDLPFPKNIIGSLNIPSAVLVEDCQFPEYVKRNVFLPRAAYLRNVVFPQRVGGSEILSNVQVAKNVIFSDYVGNAFMLQSATDVEDSLFPKEANIFDISSLKKTQTLCLPEHAKIININNLNEARWIIMPNKMNNPEEAVIKMSHFKDYNKLVMPSKKEGQLNVLNALKRSINEFITQDNTNELVSTLSQRCGIEETELVPVDYQVKPIDDNLVVTSSNNKRELLTKVNIVDKLRRTGSNLKAKVKSLGNYFDKNK